MSRESQYNVTVRVGDLNLSTFDRLSGGEIDSEETKYRPGGMAAQVSLGGSRSVGNVTVSRLYDLSRDHSITPTLIQLVGKAAMTVTKQPLNIEGVATGTPTVYTGTLKSLTLPDHNSESDDAAMIELEMSSATVA